MPHSLLFYSILMYLELSPMPDLAIPITSRYHYVQDLPRTEYTGTIRNRWFFRCVKGNSCSLVGRTFVSWITKSPSLTTSHPVLARVCKAKTSWALASPLAFTRAMANSSWLPRIQMNLAVSPDSCSVYPCLPFRLEVMMTAQHLEQITCCLAACKGSLQQHWNRKLISDGAAQFLRDVHYTNLILWMGLQHGKRHTQSNSTTLK